MEFPLIQFLIDVVIMVTPLIFILMGELLLQRSGMVNFGLNGIVLFSSIISFIVYQNGSSIAFAFLVAIISGIVFSLILGLLNIYLALPILISGFVLALLGGNLAQFIGTEYIADIGTIFQPVSIPLLNKIPIFGPVFFEQNVWVYIAHLVVLGTWIWVYKSRFGKILIGLGDNPIALKRRGYRINQIRFLYLAFAGVMTGIGAFLYVFLVDLGWRGTVASFNGIGWFIFALLMIGTWQPGRTLIFAYLFAAMNVAVTYLQNTGVVLDFQVFNDAPQVIIVLLLALIFFRKQKWMITPIRKILSQELTFVKRVPQMISTQTQPLVQNSEIDEG